MKNGKRAVYRMGDRGNSIDPIKNCHYGRLSGRKIRAGRQDLVKFFLPCLFITGALFFLQDTLVQLTAPLAMNCRIEPVDTKIARDIVPVGIKVSDNDHLAEALQHHRKQHDSDDQLSKTQYDHGISEHAAQN